MYDYFYGAEAEQFFFYRIPKVLFTEERFRSVSAEAKVLYGLLLDRMSLSCKNGWLDQAGRVYIIFTIDEVMTALGCADQKAGKLLHELESKCRLIERKRQGLGKPNLIYVKNFVDKAADNPVDNTSGSTAPSPESRFLNRENHDSGAVKITDQESLKSRSNNTENNDTDFSDTVFDVQQTAGKPLPELAANLTGDVQNYGVFMEALRRSAPVPICFEKLAENMDGYFSVDKQRIAIREGMSEVQTVCAAVHEIAHSRLHNKDEIGEKYQAVELLGKPALFSNGRIDRDKLPEGLYAYDLRGSDYDPGLPVTIQEHVVVNHAATVIAAAPIELPEQGFLYLGEDGLNFTGGEQTVKEFLHAQYPEKAKLSRAAEEIQAESISFAVCAYYGIETGENSFGYLATWAKDRELTELRASLETINRTSSSLITDIDRHYAEICKERGLDKETESLAAQPVQEIAVQEPEPVTVPDNGCVPDPAISVESMNAYGYTDSNMLPLTKERALELMERDVSVYMLHTDNTEAMAFDAEEVRSFDGVFGVEASEWETVKDRFVPPGYEKAFLDNTADSFSIYQLRDNDNTAQLRFMNAEYLAQKGLSIEKENYAAVYAGCLDRRGDTQDRLDELYETFNIRRPEDFRGHSLSVSDIVALKQNGVVSCHYVDSRGFKALPDFLKPENYLKNAEMAMEDDYGMIDGVINNGPKQTVAELEEQAKSGKSISEHYCDNVLHREAVAQVAEQFGHERILYVLAITIRQKDWDGRFSADNKQWAKTVPVAENPDAWGTDRNCYLAVNSHSGLVDLFTKLAREDARAHERKPSVLGRLKNRPPEAAAEAVKKTKEPSL